MMVEVVGHGQGRTGQVSIPALREVDTHACVFLCFYVTLLRSESDQ